MQHSLSVVHKALPILLIITLLYVPSSPADTRSLTRTSAFDEVTARLIEDGFTSTSVYKHFDDPRSDILPQLLKINLKQPDATGAYDRFKADASVSDTYRYLTKNRAVFDSVLADSRVSAEVVAAILKIESDFGSNQGKYPLFNVFATLSLLNSQQLETLAPGFWNRVLADVPENEREAAITKANSRRRSKANWAYRELKTLLEMSENGMIDPLNEKGSWAGAYGMAQFLPSSFQAYARDGSGDNHIDLDTLEDSIASVANYLERHRFTTENEQRRRKAVWHYNHSEDYVDAVITLADRVAKKGEDTQTQ
jgi:peptidoglycan lytic transglycosylase B